MSIEFTKSARSLSKDEIARFETLYVPRAREARYAEMHFYGNLYGNNFWPIPVSTPLK